MYNGALELTYEHRWCFEQVTERVMQQIQNGAGVNIREANELTGKERLTRSYIQPVAPYKTIYSALKQRKLKHK